MNIHRSFLVGPGLLESSERLAQVWYDAISACMDRWSVGLRRMVAGENVNRRSELVG